MYQTKHKNCLDFVSGVFSVDLIPRKKNENSRRRARRCRQTSSFSIAADPNLPRRSSAPSPAPPSSSLGGAPRRRDTVEATYTACSSPVSPLGGARPVALSTPSVRDFSRAPGDNRCGLASPLPPSPPPPPLPMDVETPLVTGSTSRPPFTPPATPAVAAGGRGAVRWRSTDDARGLEGRGRGCAGRGVDGENVGVF